MIKNPGGAEDEEEDEEGNLGDSLGYLIEEFAKKPDKFLPFLEKYLEKSHTTQEMNLTHQWKIFIS